MATLVVQAKIPCHFCVLVKAEEAPLVKDSCTDSLIRGAIAKAKSRRDRLRDDVVESTSVVGSLDSDITPMREMRTAA